MIGLGDNPAQAFRLLRWGLIGIAAGLPSPAAAAPFEAVAPLTVAAIAWFLACAAIVGLVVIRARIRRLKSAQAETAATLDRLLDVMAGAGSGLFLWSWPKGTQSVSPNLSTLFGLPEGRAVGFSDLREALRPEDAKELNAAVERLHQEGERFALELGLAENGACLRALGFRLDGHEAGSANGAATDILWVQDDREASSARQALTAERDRLRRLLDALPVPVWTRNGSLDIVDCNRSYAEAVESGSVVEAVAGGAELAGSVVADGGKGLARSVCTSGEAQAVSHHIVVGGSRRLLELNELPLENGAIAGFALDVTAIEDAQSELARHVGAHGEVLEKLATAIAIFGSDRRLRFFNGGYVKLWHMDEAWLHTQPLMDEILEHQRERRQLPETANFPAFKEERLKLFTSLIETTEELLHLPDGRAIRMVCSPHPMGGLIYTYEDVTDRLALERSYNTLIEVQRETLHNLAEAVAVFGGDGRLKLFTPAMEHMWSLPRDFLESEPHASDVLERARPFFRAGDKWESFKAAVIGRIARRVMRRGKIERSDGSVIEHGFMPLPDGGVLVRNLDITDSARVARALRERNEALEAADRLKSEFIANVSYELRTPLNTIMGFIEILNNEYFGKLNKRQREYSKGILESSQELLALINDILDLAMIEAGRMTLEIESVDIPSLLESIANLTRERARQKQLTLKVDCPDDIGVLDLDERRTKHALLNLVGNAVEFTQPGGVITLGAERLVDEVALTVSDTGVGIPDAEQSRIFDMFVRGKKPMGRRPGAGLGLSLVKSFIDIHGGRIEIESTPNVGTKVTCFFPVQRAGGRAALTADLFEADRTATG